MTLAITAKAASLRASGIDVIGFGVGEPDFPTPAHIVEAAIEAAADPKNHHYSATAGLGELREAIAAASTESGRPTTVDEVVVTNGAKHAVFAALSVVVDAGDEVLIPTPYWVTYPEATRLVGGRPVFVETDFSSEFRVSVDQLEEARTDMTRALLFASPSNPTGIVYSAEEIRSIAQWADENRIWLIADEIYDRLVYDDNFASVGSFLPDGAFLINGVSKTYAMTGWRLGWLVAPSDMAKAAARIQSHTTSNVNNVAQWAALAALTGDQSVVTSMKEAFDRRRLAMIGHLRTPADLTVTEPTGAFYVFPYLGDRLTRPVAGTPVDNTLELASLLLDEARIAVVPGEPFGAPGYVRFSYALSDEELGEGMARFVSLLEG